MPESAVTARGSKPASARAWLTAALWATVAQYLLGIGFIVSRGVFAPLSDLAVAVTVVTLVPVAWHLHLVHRGADPMASLAGVALALVGLGVAGIASVALIVSDLGGPLLFGTPWLAVQFGGLVLQGCWLLVIGLLGLRQGTFKRRTWVMAVVAGSGYVVGTIANALWGFTSPLFYAGFLAAAVGFLSWAVLLRRDLVAP